MRDKEIVGLYQAYLDVYSNSNEEVEQLDEDVQGAVDNVTKRVQSGLEKIGFPINRTPKGTQTQAQQERKIKPVGEEVEQLDELSSEVMARAKHKRMQNLAAAQKKEMGARDAGATMGEISKRAEETSDAAAKFSKHNQLSSRHARSRKRMRDAGQNVNASYEYDTFDAILEHLVAEGYADTNESALAIMANMSDEWRESIVEAAADQSDKQIEKGVKTTYKAQNVLDNQHQGRSKGLNKLPRGEREEKAKRMRGRLKARRDDLFGERNKREDESRAEIKRKYGL